ncbi:type II secretion system protein [Anaerobacillus sp. CMMVII]|uniref:type II secretion system protein n=1 Tax=Anaerobacillus sp. CMMVII TaxID=2755588 RepID=UPI0021B7254D|nr:type II secretion system protein [Anaerobacillus sp. CMMVII]MCT8138672.1 type II secretion system protein [Anaerobacillus sp. CMMVII]
MRNCKGFSLIEVMTALMVVIVITLILIPTLAIVYEERMAIQQEKKAMNLLSKTITGWIYEENGNLETEVTDLDTIYKITTTVKEESQELKACIAWRAANDRQYEKCASGKR